VPGHGSHVGGRGIWVGCKLLGTETRHQWLQTCNLARHRQPLRDGSTLAVNLTCYVDNPRVRESKVVLVREKTVNVKE
jgi:hypothetical protein